MYYDPGLLRQNPTLCRNPTLLRNRHNSHIFVPNWDRKHEKSLFLGQKPTKHFFEKYNGIHALCQKQNHCLPAKTKPFSKSAIIFIHSAKNCIWNCTFSSRSDTFFPLSLSLSVVILCTHLRPPEKPSSCQIGTTTTEMKTIHFPSWKDVQVESCTCCKSAWLCVCVCVQPANEYALLDHTLFSRYNIQIVDVFYRNGKKGRASAN